MALSLGVVATVTRHGPVPRVTPSLAARGPLLPLHVAFPGCKLQDVFLLLFYLALRPESSGGAGGGQDS